MRLSLLSWLLPAVVLGSGSAFAQTSQACLHRGLEAAEEVQRRDEALLAMRLIDQALLQRSPFSRAPYPTWEELAGSPAIPPLRGMGDQMGEVARKMRWGTDEPLPGWQIHYVAGRDGYAFSLTDVRDPCGFTYYANDTGAIAEGHQLRDSRRGRIVPIT
jgi:hypothetical protein